MRRYVFDVLSVIYVECLLAQRSDVYIHIAT